MMTQLSTFLLLVALAGSLSSCIQGQNSGLLSLSSKREGSGYPEVPEEIDTATNRKNSAGDTDSSLNSASELLSVNWRPISGARLNQSGQVELMETEGANSFSGQIASESPIKDERIIHELSDSQDHYFIGLEGEETSLEIKVQEGKLIAFANGGLQKTIRDSSKVGETISFQRDPQSGILGVFHNARLIFQFERPIDSEAKIIGRFWGSANRNIDFNRTYRTAGKDIVGLVDNELPDQAPMPNPTPLPESDPIPEVDTDLSATVVQGNGSSIWLLSVDKFQNPRAQDFKLLGSHAQIVDARLSDNSEAIELRLDDSVLPDDPLRLDYFSPSGTLRDGAGGKIASFRISVENNLSEYTGSKRVVRLEASANLQATIASDTIIALKRGATYRGSILISNQEHVVLTAYGGGAAPQLQAERDKFCVEVRSSDHIRIANLDLVGNNSTCVSYIGLSSFGVVKSNLIRSSSPRGDASALVLYKSTGTSGEQSRYNEGMVAVGNIIRNYDDCISAKLEPRKERPISTMERHLGGNQTPYLVELNHIEGATLNGNEGDAIQVSRGGYFNSKIRRNRITGWADDGIDLYGVRDMIIEYNHLENNNDALNSNSSYSGSGNGIKMGGSGGSLNSMSGGITVRHNLITKTIRKRSNGDYSNNGIGLSTNGSAGYNKRNFVLDNIVVNTSGHAFQIDRSNAGLWEVQNNVFFHTESDRVSAGHWRANNLDELVFRNNRYKSMRSDFIRDARIDLKSNSKIDSAGGNYSEQIKALHLLDVL